MAYKIFIDGQEGTTGLKIIERFKDRTDVEILKIDEDLRKSALERKRLINESDFTFLCLPDAAAIESLNNLKSSSAFLTVYKNLVCHFNSFLSLLSSI